MSIKCCENTYNLLYYEIMKKAIINNLQVDEKLVNFINQEAVPGTNINIDDFWNNFSKAVHELASINKSLI